MNLKGSGRKQLWPNRGTVPIFPWRERKNHENPLRQAGVSTDIRTQYLLKRAQVVTGTTCSVPLLQDPFLARFPYFEE
jgi:hypothetical protein